MSGEGNQQDPNNPAG